MMKCIPMAPNSKIMRMYSENAPLSPSDFSSQCINAMSLWSIFSEIFCVYISKYLYIPPFFYDMLK